MPRLPGLRILTVRVTSLSPGGRLKKLFPALCAAILVLTPGCSPGGHAGKVSIRVGVGETVITPQKNMQMAGFARSQRSTGIHDDLHARSLAVEDSRGGSVLLMAVSLVGLNEEFGDRIRKGITAQTGIPGDRIVISCTHTHSGPNVPRGGDEYSESSDGPEYGEFLVERCVESAVWAWRGRVTGRIGVGKTEVFELGRNRRRLQYGGLHPDPMVTVIRIEDAKGRLLGVAFNYGCHPSGLDFRNTLFSEDWPYYTIREIRKKLGENVWTAFYQSAEGNINVGYTAELSAVGAEMGVRTYEYAEKKGRQMAEAVLGALPSIPVSGDIEVKTASGRRDYPLRDSYPVTIAQAGKDAAEAKARLDDLEKRPELEGTRTLDRARVDVFQTGQRLDGAKRFFGDPNRPSALSIEQQAVRIGDAVFVTFPGELFAEVGLEIKKGSPVEKTFVIGVTCGPGGYLPAAKEYIDGDYEIDGSSYSPKAEQACISASLDLIGRVAR
jgi:neutral ceramidase